MASNEVQSNDKTNINSIPSLSECISTIKQLGSERSALSSKGQAQLFTTCVAFLIHIQIDRDFILNINIAKPCEIPAITALLSDRDLFFIFMAMLSPNKNYNCNTAIMDDARQGPTNINKPTLSVTSSTQNRKRSYSTSSNENSEIPHKLAKTFSPKSNSLDPSKQTHVISSIPSDTQPSPCLDIKFPILAAIVLFASLEYVDEWPWIILRAYAEDSFGSRVWVDDERCSLFKANLHLALHLYDNLLHSDSTTNDYLLYYNRFLNDAISENWNDAHVSRGSQNESSVSSESDSDSGDEILEVTSGTALPTKPLLQQLPKKDNYESISISRKFPDMTFFSSSNTDVEAWRFPIKYNPSQVRPRYFGANRDQGCVIITEALTERLDANMKQNSGLLSSLPSFVAMPQVRKIAAQHLEKWLKSPALSSLARQLFIKIVSEIKNIDPMPQDDIEVIECILHMDLKSNQHTFFVENVTTIVKNVPTIQIATQIMLHLLTEQLDSVDASVVVDEKDHSIIFKTIFSTLDASLAYKALSMTMLNLASKVSRLEDNTNRKQRLRLLSKMVVRNVGNIFDAPLLIKEIVHHTDNIFNPSDDLLDLHAQLLFELMLLMIPTQSFSRNQISSFVKGGSIDDPEFHSEIIKFIPKLNSVRKLVMEFCLKHYLNKAQNRNDFSKNTTVSSHTELLGAGVPNYRSVLDGKSTIGEEYTFHEIMNCLLFLVPSESKDYLSFLGRNPNDGISVGSSDDDLSSQFKITVWCNYGLSIDSDTLRIITASSCQCDDNALLIYILEILFHQCRLGRYCSFSVDDYSLVGKLYELTVYDPGIREADIPRLALPGLWWRVTAIVLILSGHSPNTIGANIWEDNPTIKILIKMSITSRYLFPTVDCDDAECEAIKKSEFRIRNQEGSIAQKLFLRESETSTTKIHDDSTSHRTFDQGGSRSSARQRERNEKLLELRRQKEQSLKLAEEIRIKRLLYNAQKSIMIWDPKASARKPPKDAIHLLHSVDYCFNLSTRFKACVDPDFLLRIISPTSRETIERAYSWLIPVVYTCPQIIKRLPSNASCFLLLRAYGSDAHLDNQLLELSSPLLNHVTDSLSGAFGEENSLKALDLILQDVAEKSLDRRHCARQVLQSALGSFRPMETDVISYKILDVSWPFTLLHLKYAHSLATTAIPYLCRCLNYERGEVLCAYVCALERFILFTSSSRLNASRKLSTILSDLLSSRPHVCCAAMDSFSNFRELVVRTIYDRFIECLTCHNESDNESPLINIHLIVESKKLDKIENGVVRIFLPSSLLRASIVLISNWSDDLRKRNSGTDYSSKDSIISLTQFLLPSINSSSAELDLHQVGAASATYEDSEVRAVSVEEWVMLAKSRCDLIARNAALSAPELYLPRLLLCCGLPLSSFSSMIERLDKLGSKIPDSTKVFSHLISHELGRGTKKYFIIRKLLGRISAYTKIFNHYTSSEKSSFIAWLEFECNNDKTKGMKLSPAKKDHPMFPNDLTTFSKEANNIASIISSSLIESDVERNLTLYSEYQYPIMETIDSSSPRVKTSTDLNISLHFKHQQYDKVDSLLENLFSSFLSSKNSKSDPQLHVNTSTINNIAIELLQCFLTSREASNRCLNLILKWIPILSQNCDNTFYSLLLLQSKSNKFIPLVTAKCLSERWSDDQILFFTKYVLTELIKCDTKIDSISSFVKFLLGTSNAWSSSIAQQSASVPLFARGLDFTTATIEIALRGMENWCRQENRYPFYNQLVERKILPDWFHLLLSIGNCGEHQLEMTVNRILEKISINKKDSYEDEVLHFALLQLYFRYPSKFNINGVQVRHALTTTMEKRSNRWLLLDSSVDDEIRIAMNYLVSGSFQRHSQCVLQLFKKYPIFFLKYIPSVIDILRCDANYVSRQESERRGRVNAHYGTRSATVDNNSLEVRVICWGCGFSDSLWELFLDVVMSLPNDVAFECGCYNGLLDLLQLYLSLILVQVDVGGQNNSNITRIREKFTQVLVAFRSSCPTLYEKWQGMNGDSLGDIIDFDEILD